MRNRIVVYCSSLAHLMMILLAQTIQHRVIRLLINIELERKWKKVVVAYFEVLFQHLFGDT
jgi:hypothetical protein